MEKRSGAVTVGYECCWGGRLEKGREQLGSKSNQQSWRLLSLGSFPVLMWAMFSMCSPEVMQWDISRK